MMTRKLNCVIEANAILGFQSIVSSTNWIFEFDDDPFVSFPIEYFFFQYGFFLLKLMHCRRREAEVISDGSTRNLGFGFQKCHGEMGLRQVRNKAFLAQIFGTFDDFLIWSALQNFEKSSNMPKTWQNMKKSLVQRAF